MGKQEKQEHGKGSGKKQIYGDFKWHITLEHNKKSEISSQKLKFF